MKLFDLKKGDIYMTDSREWWKVVIEKTENEIFWAELEYNLGIGKVHSTNDYYGNYIEVTQTTTYNELLKEHLENHNFIVSE